MLTGRSFKTTLCIVGALGSWFGIDSRFFQVDDAEATHSSWTCIFKQHRYAGSGTGTGTKPTGSTGTAYTTLRELCRGTE